MKLYFWTKLSSQLTFKTHYSSKIMRNTTSLTWTYLPILYWIKLTATERMMDQTNKLMV